MIDRASRLVEIFRNKVVELGFLAIGEGDIHGIEQALEFLLNNQRGGGLYFELIRGSEIEVGSIELDLVVFPEINVARVSETAETDVGSGAESLVDVLQNSAVCDLKYLGSFRNRLSRDLGIDLFFRLLFRGCLLFCLLSVWEGIVGASKSYLPPSPWKPRQQ